jgi:hypothetical protein
LLKLVKTNPVRPDIPSVIVTAQQVMYTQSGYSGYSGFSGFSGINGVIGSNGASGYSGYSGFGHSVVILVIVVWD